MTRSIVPLAVVAVAACGSEPFSSPEARSLFAYSNDLVHALHSEAFALPEWPATYELACPEGGRITMTSELTPSGQPDTLWHPFIGCGVGGWVLDGQLDYLGITFCDANAPSFAMVGRFEVADHGECVIDAQETCGVVTRGEACGVTL